MIEFQWPWLFLLLPLPFLFRPKAGNAISIGEAVVVPSYRQLSVQGLTQTIAKSETPKWLKMMLLGSWILLITAIARPSYIGEPVSIPQSGRDLMLAVDISPSMQEQDMIIGNRQVDRLSAVKYVVSQFIEQRKGDRVGLILFGSEPYIQAPLTFDLETVNQLLIEAQLGMAGKATAIGDATALAVKRLRDRPKESRILILLTDGANTAGEIPPEKAAQLAAEEEIKIYTVGIGAEEMIKQSFFGSRKVNPSADLDEALLTQIANQTNGQYFRARSAPELELIYESINQQEPIEQDAKTFRPTRSLFHWPLAFSFALFIVTVLAKRMGPVLSRARG